MNKYKLHDHFCIVLRVFGGCWDTQIFPRLIIGLDQFLHQKNHEVTPPGQTPAATVFQEGLLTEPIQLTQKTELYGYFGFYGQWWKDSMVCKSPLLDCS